VPDYPPLYILGQAMWTLDQDWDIDFADEFAALEDWFAADGIRPEVLKPLIADVDQLFADEPSAEARLAHFPHTGLRSDTFDEFLRAIRKRAEDGLAGNPQPMRRPAAG
jgi:hypothetical protein